MKLELPQVEYKKRVSRIIPYGWEIDDETPDRLRSVPLEIAALNKAIELLKTGQHSTRKMSEWLSTITGRYLSHNGLYKILKNDRTNNFRRRSPYGRKAKAEK